MGWGRKTGPARGHQGLAWTRGAQEVEAETVEPASGGLMEVEAEGQGLSWGGAADNQG